MVNEQIAKQIIDKTKSILGKDTLFSSPSGICLASSISKFKDNFLGGAVESIYKKKIVKNAGLTWVPIFSKSKTEGSIGILGKGDLTKETIKLVQNLVEVMIFEITFINKLNSDLKQQEEFSRNLLTTNKFRVKEDALSQADVLRINLRFNHALMIFRAHNLKEIFLLKKSRSKKEETFDFSDFVDDIKNALKQTFGNSSANSFIYWEPNTFIVLKELNVEKNSKRIKNSFKKDALIIKKIIQKKTGVEVSGGLGQYYPDLKGLKKSYSEARLALEVGVRVWGNEKIYHILDVGIFAILDNTKDKGTDDRVKKQIVYQILSPLIEKKSLFSTLKIFLDSEMNLTKSAKKNHIHRNTLIYRLNKIKKLIGLDPRIFEDALQIKLGLMFLS